MTSKIFVALIIFLCVGCGSLNFGSGPHARWPYYAIGFANRTNEQFSGVKAEWVTNGAKYSPAAGLLAPGSRAEYCNAPDPIPPSATVIWLTPDGKEHRQTLEVAKRIPDIKTWAGTVWFKITVDGVQLLPLSDKQMHDLARAAKEYP